MIVRVNTMPPRQSGKHQSAPHNLRPVYLSECPDCRNTKFIIRHNKQHSRSYLVPCKRCKEVT